MKKVQPVTLTRKLDRKSVVNYLKGFFIEVGVSPFDWGLDCYSIPGGATIYLGPIDISVGSHNA